MYYLFRVCLVLTIITIVIASDDPQQKLNNEVDNDDLIRTNNNEDFVTSVINECSSLNCVKDKFLNYLDSLLGLDEDDARKFQNENLDEEIFDRMARLLKTKKYSFQLGGIELSYNPTTGVNLDLPPQDGEDQVTAEARGLLKKKLLLPVLLLLKLKLKALTPIILLATAMKSLKALIMSKLALLGVIGFLVYELVLKKGMKPGAMMPIETTTPADSYDPSWSPNSGGPYSRIWTASNSNDDTSHNLAYSAYYPVSGISTRSPP